MGPDQCLLGTSGFPKGRLCCRLSCCSCRWRMRSRSAKASSPTNPGTASVSARAASSIACRADALAMPRRRYRDRWAWWVATSVLHPLLTSSTASVALQSVAEPANLARQVLDSIRLGNGQALIGYRIDARTGQCPRQLVQLQQL